MGSPSCGITRRGFLAGTAAGLVTGVPLSYLAAQRLSANSFNGKSVEIAKPSFAMPGPFPGRVVEVHDPAAVTVDNVIQKDSVERMMARGMCELTGADHAQAAWKRFFARDEIVGIKVNPVGRKRRTEVGSISSPEVLLEVVKGLKSAGVKPKDIVVFERYADEFRDAGYEKVLREPALDGVRWYASAAHYSEEQVDIEGYDGRRDYDKHVAGYDPDVFVNMGFASTAHDGKDDRRFRSHVSAIVTRLVDKFVTIPVLKDHRSAGVTLALKNMSHGMNNNVARSHIGGIKRGNHVSGPNQCNTFIPTCVSQTVIRQKATLHIMDGLIGVYEGGPGSWNRTWATWRHKSLFFATDPVAMDRVGWDIIDAKRLREGWPTVAQMGLHTLATGRRTAAGLVPLGSAQVPAALVLTAAADNWVGGQASESFDRRQPEHVVLAGTIGLGIFDSGRIDHRTVMV